MAKKTFLYDICSNCGGVGVLPKINLDDTLLDHFVDDCEDCVDCGGTGHSINYRRVPMLNHCTSISVPSSLLLILHRIQLLREALCEPVY